MSRPPDVIVIGAGFAGLSAAAALADRGARVLVLEKRSRLGGRATAFRDRETGERVDNGQHVLVGCYHETFRFLRRVGAESFVQRQPQLAVTMVDGAGVVSRLACPRRLPDGPGGLPLPSPLHLLAGVLGWRALGWGDRLSALRMAGPLRRARAQWEQWRTSGMSGTSGASGASGTSGRAGAAAHAEPSGESVEAWLIRCGQTSRLREMLWEPLALAALNQPPDAASMTYFARVLAEMFGPDPDGASLVLPTRPLDEMYAEPARAFIEARGGEVRTGAEASVTIAPDGAAVGVERAVGDARAAADTGEARARAGGVTEAIRPAVVVVAVPWYALPSLFRGDTTALDGTLAAARATAASPIVTVNLWFDRPILGEPFIGLPGRRMQWVFEKRLLVGEGAAHLSLVSSGAGEVLDRTNEEVVAQAAGELRAALPACAAARMLRATVIREPRATFSLAPGQPPRPDARTAVPGLYLAGDWIATGLPATIESAVRSGHRAADLALADGARA